MPGASAFNIVDAELSGTGRSLALIVEGVDSARAFVSVLALGTPAGGISKIVKLDGFAARHLAFATDETVWVLGRAYGPNGEERTDYQTLRHFGRDGVLLGEALPRSAYTGSASTLSPTNDAILISGLDRIGVLSVSTNQWFEVGAAGSLIGNYPIHLAASGRITGAAITAKGDVFVSTETDPNQTSQRMTAQQAITLRKFERPSGELIEVDTSAIRSSSHQGVLLLGSEGDQLIVRVKPPWKLSWIDVRGRTAED